MKYLMTVLILCLAFTANAKEVSQPRKEARCWWYGHVSGLSKDELKTHVSLAKKGLSESDLYYEIGYADGFIIGLTVGKGKSAKKKAAYDLYSAHCIISI